MPEVGDLGNLTDHLVQQGNRIWKFWTRKPAQAIQMQLTPNSGKLSPPAVTEHWLCSPEQYENVTDKATLATKCKIYLWDTRQRSHGIAFCDQSK